MSPFLVLVQIFFVAFLPSQCGRNCPGLVVSSSFYRHPKASKAPVATRRLRIWHIHISGNIYIGSVSWIAVQNLVVRLRTALRAWGSLGLWFVEFHKSNILKRCNRKLWTFQSIRTSHSYCNLSSFSQKYKHFCTFLALCHCEPPSFGTNSKVWKRNRSLILLTRLCNQPIQKSFFDSSFGHFLCFHCPQFFPPSLSFLFHFFVVLSFILDCGCSVVSFMNMTMSYGILSRKKNDLDLVRIYHTLFFQSHTLFFQSRVGKNRSDE